VNHQNPSSQISRPDLRICASRTSAPRSVRRHFQSEHLASPWALSIPPSLLLYFCSSRHNLPSLPYPATPTSQHTHSQWYANIPILRFRVQVLTGGQAQTPQQRQANMRFAKAQEKKMGQPQGEVIKKREPQKSPISKIWISTLPSGADTSILEGIREDGLANRLVVVLLGFVLCGGLLFEVLKMFF
jgi:hypothetical protein